MRILHANCEHRAADEELEESPLRDLHQASQAALATGAPLDANVVAGWADFDRKLQLLAEDVRQAAPAGLFDAAGPPTLCRAPSSATQMEQLQCLTKVQRDKCVASDLLFVAVRTSRL